MWEENRAEWRVSMTEKRSLSERRSNKGRPATTDEKREHRHGGLVSLFVVWWGQRVVIQVSVRAKKSRGCKGA